MMKHILETKHVDPNFKCAVIVNDMAALNIDKSLIDQSALVQSDEVVAMQNGCFCCTLQSDLVDQILELVKKQKFNYMLIEASGVSEPAQIAPLFELHEHDDDDPEMMDHEHDPDKPQLGEVGTVHMYTDITGFVSGGQTRHLRHGGGQRRVLQQPGQHGHFRERGDHGNYC